ncbi:hypothetical protein [Flammeovirga sp. SJP92]|uniref:hypothetical protein n=1 Tax=Flammeovirga sp. SJP92 TaxID=1775430 RepID=UPI00155FA936|nr:hypothetical protein [Flammeovirga sp. SJP92]
MTFLQLNKHKLKYLIITCTLIGFVASELFYWGIMHNNQNEINLLINVSTCLSIGFIFTLIVFSFAYIEWASKMYFRQKVYKLISMKELKLYGFKFKKINTDSNFFFTEEILEGKIEGFNVFFDSLDFNLIKIFMEVKPSRSIGKIEFSEIESKMAHLNGKLVYGGVSIHYKKERLLKMNTKMIINEIEDIILLLTAHDIQPLNKA